MDYYHKAKNNWVIKIQGEKKSLKLKLNTKTGTLGKQKTYRKVTDLITELFHCLAM